MLSRLRHVRGERDEAGVVAIIVALSLSTFLLAFAALAVDLGAAYTRRADLQNTAEQLAMAGAAGLPRTADALTDLEDARVQLCNSHPLPGICDADLPATWARDGDLSNGEVRFYTDQGQGGTFADLRNPPGLDPDDFLNYNVFDGATGIRVTLPPSHVEFGLASAMGFSGVDVTREATARIGTPLGLGILPFPLKPADLARGEFCATDLSATGGPSAPAPTNTVTATWPGWLIPPLPSGPTPSVPGDSGDQHVTLGLHVDIPFRTVNLGSVVWHASNSTATNQVVGSTLINENPFLPRHWDITVPESPAGTTVDVWATGRLSGSRRTFVSDSVPVTFTGPATGADDGLCDQLDAQHRGVLDLARPAGAGGLTENVRQGPAVKLYDSTSTLGTQILNNTLDCVSNIFAPSTSCVSQDILGSWSTAVSNGLLTSSGSAPGRLAGDCGNGTVSVRGGARVDASQLISGSSSPFLADRAPIDLYDRILGAGTAAGDDDWAGVISSGALRCPRLAVMPVIEPFSLAGVTGAQKIVKFVYVWIDQAPSSGPGRGLKFTGSGQLASVRGYVLEPGLFPKEVAGSPVVGPYLGDDMPKQVVLVHDLGADGT